MKDLDEKLYQNRLYAVIDDVPAIDFPDDIDGIDYAFVTDPALINTDNNYGYDQLGQLVRDDEESIEEIIWRIDGKISSILREDASGKSELSFVYDALGNRVAQKVYDDSGNWQKTTYYTRDAQGNVMAVYEYTEVESESVLSFSEVHKYGSSRLGIRIPQGTPDLIGATDPEADETLSLERGNDRFELSNHLGNVLSIVSDRILPIEDGNTGIVSHHRPEVLTVMDYYPFGVMMEDRSYTDLESHRYGFNGMEKDDELKGEGNSYDFGARAYDNRLGRWLSVDPHAGFYPFSSSYNYVNNMPIIAVDPNGKDIVILIWQPTGGDQGHVAIAVENYKMVEGKVISTGTYTLYDATALQSNDIEAFVKDPARIVDGQVRKHGEKEWTISELKDFETSSGKATVLYKIDTWNENDRVAHEIIDGLLTRPIGKYNFEENSFDDYSNIQPYSLVRHKDRCDVISCAGLVTTILNEAYNLRDVGIEHIKTKGGSFFGYSIPPLDAMASTPNGFIRDMNSAIARGSKYVKALTATPEAGNFIDMVTGGKLEDETPGK